MVLRVPPQTILGIFAGTVRKVLGISGKFKITFGISFGYGDKEALGNSSRTDRETVAHNVIFHR